MCMAMAEGNFMNLLTIRNGSLPYVVQNERYASSDVSVLISFARVSIVPVNSPILQSHRQKNGCQIIPSWRPPGKSSPVGNASP